MRGMLINRVSNKLVSAKVNPNRPIAFEVGRYKGKDGVFVLAKNNGSKNAFFYPAEQIEEKIAGKNGRGKYVYQEGFNQEKIVKGLRSIIAPELPAWSPVVQSLGEFYLNRLLVSQPGVDLWRMLCFALDHSRFPEKFMEESPSLFSIHVPLLNHVLYAGNHRALFALASGIEKVKLNFVNIPGRAIDFIAQARTSVDYVRDTFGKQGVLALAESFIRQL